jgi:hypothetical protein
MRICAATLLLSVLIGCSKTPVAGPKIDPALYLLIPSDTVMLAGTRLDSIESTEVYKKYLSQRSLPQIEDFARQTGIDPRKDLWQLLYISNGKNSAVMGRAMFSDESEPKLQKNGATRFSYKGLTLVGDEQTAILLVGPTVVGVGDTAELKAIVDAKDKSTAGPPPAMAELMKDIPPEAQFWVAYRGGPIQMPFDATGNLSNINQIVKLIQTGTLYLDLSSGIKGLAVGPGNTEHDAGELESGLKALVAFGRLSTPANQPDLQRIWDGLTVTRQDRVVKLHIDEPAELVDRALALWLGPSPRPGKNK